MCDSYAPVQVLRMELSFKYGVASGDRGRSAGVSLEELVWDATSEVLDRSSQLGILVVKLDDDGRRRLPQDLPRLLSKDSR